MSQIGLGWKIQVDDGAANAFVDITAVTNLNVPSDGPFGTVESKRLDITNKTVTRVPTVKTPGSFSFTYEFDKTQFARLELIRGIEKNWKVSSTDAVAWTRTAPGVLVEQKIEGVSADGIVQVACTVEVTGAAT